MADKVIFGDLGLEITELPVPVQKVLNGEKALPKGFHLVYDKDETESKNRIKMIVTDEQLRHDSWDASRELLERLWEIGTPAKELTFIYAVARGGWYWGQAFSHEIDRKGIGSLEAKSYFGMQARKAKVRIPFWLRLLRGWKTLLIDDLVDSGGTYKKFKKILPSCFFAVMYTKELAEVDWYFKKIPDIWLIFPWEFDHRQLPIVDF